MLLRRYVPSGRGGPVAIAAVLGVALVSGVAVGAFEGAIDKWFSLFLVFPALIGLAAGGGAVWMVQRQRLRAPLLALVLGAAGGAAGYLAIHVVDYARFRSDIGGAYSGQNPQASEAETAAAIDEILVEETGESGFRGFLEIAARNGVSIKHMGASDKGLALTGTGAWLLWLGELLVAAGIAGFMARGRAKEPFCEACEVWYGPEQTLAIGGSGEKLAHRAVLAAFDSGDLDAAAGALAVPPTPRGNFVLTASTCPQCAAEAHCTLKRVTTKKQKPEVSVLDTWLLTKDDVTRFSDALARAHAQPRPGGLSG